MVSVSSRYPHGVSYTRPMGERPYLASLSLGLLARWLIQKYLENAQLPVCLFFVILALHPLILSRGVHLGVDMASTECFCLYILFLRSMR